MNGKPPVIFLTFANYFGESQGHLRNLPLESSEVNEALRQAATDGLCEVVTRSNVTLKEIVSVFQDKRYKGRIVAFHFGGHARSYELVLETPLRKENVIYSQGFAAFLKEQEGLQMVFLNACTTHLQAELLTQEGIPAVISTNALVQDEVAKDLAVYFYGFLGVGDCLSQAFNKSVSLIKGKRGNTVGWRALYRHGVQTDQVPWKIALNPDRDYIINWNLPDVAENPLYGLPVHKAVLPFRPFPGMKPYDETYAEVFFGRKWQIKRLYDLLTSQKELSATLVYGAAGVGKTSLIRAGLIPRMSDKFTIHYAAGFGALHKSIRPDRSETTASWLFVDGVGAIDPSKVEKKILSKVSGPASFNRLVICVESIHLFAWEGFFNERGIPTAKFFVPPLDESGIGEVVRGVSSSPRLRSEYRLQIEPELPGRILGLLFKDGRSPIAPVLQFLMVSLWDEAKQRKYDVPYFSWSLYQKLESEKIWSTFLVEKLVEADEKLFANGLFLSLLQTCVDRENSDAGHLEDSYPHLHKKLPDLISRLKAVHLLSNSAGDQVKEWANLILIHDLLKVPLYGLINQSERPAQRVSRILEHHMVDSVPLSEAQLDLIDRARRFSPKLTASQLDFIRQEQVAVREKRKLTKALSRMRYLVIILVLGLDGLIHDPYLLFLILLIIVLYPSNGKSYTLHKSCRK